MSNSDKHQPKLIQGRDQPSGGNGHSARKAYPPPFSLRLTFEERAVLEKAAAGMPLSAYIREKLFGPEVSHRKTRGKEPVKDHRALARVLGALGGSRLSSNLNQLARAAHMGALPVSEDLEADLQAACREVQDMRAALLAALGHRENGGPE